MNPITNAHLQRAFDLQHRADWPATLHELMAYARMAALVTGLAQRLANGQGTVLPPHPTALADQPAPQPVPLRAWDYPTRREGTRPAGHPERRRPPAGLDHKRLAAGERDDD